jgi:hypothetical protein
MNSNDLPDSELTINLSMSNFDAFILEGLQRFGVLRDLAEAREVSYGEIVIGTQGEEVVPVRVKINRSQGGALSETNGQAKTKL